jgi:alpha-L-fucosidase
MISHRAAAVVVTLVALAQGSLIAPPVRAQESRPARSEPRDRATVQAEHDMIGLGGERASARHTQHPDAQWYGDAGFGLFLHWSICSTRAMNISWPMIPGRPLAQKRIDDPAERERIIRESDWNLNGKPPAITPNQYWAMANDFNPQDYHPEKWLKAAKDAGFTYAVLTTRHHDGFALGPSKFGDFSTQNYMGGRDLVKDYVEACRKVGLKVGLYYSPPNWHFDREYMTFLYHGAVKKNPEFPSLDADLKPRTSKPDPAALKKHQAEYAQLVKGQVEELLTNYGKIDLLWFDGKPAVPDPTNVIPIERIRQLQPGIVINPRLHGTGDFITFERTLKADKPVDGWAEFCNTWTSNWSHTEQPFRDNGFILGQLAQSRSLGVNYLLGIGPMASGDISAEAYQNLAVVAGWMQKNGESIRGTKPLPANESASVPATSSGTSRYLFAIPEFRNGGMMSKDKLPAKDVTITLKGVAKPVSVTLLGDGSTLEFEPAGGGGVSIHLPAAKRSEWVDVVKVELPANTANAAASRD